MKRLCFSGDKVRRYASVDDLRAELPVPDSLQDMDGNVTTNPAWESAQFEQITLLKRGLDEEERRRIIYPPCTILPIREGTWMSKDLMAEFTIP